MNETMIISLYCMVDDFINTLMKTPAGQTVRNQWEGSRGPRRRLSLSEVITLNIMRFYLHINDLKAYHRLAGTVYRTWFPALPNYENFLKAANRSFPAIMLFLNYWLHLNRQTATGGVFYIDSTPVSVCHNPCICTHRVTKGYASRGKTFGD